MSVQLLSSNQPEVPITVPLEVCRLSVTINNMLEDFGGADTPIPLHNTDHAILEKVIDYCEKYLANKDKEKPVEEKNQNKTHLADWEKEFCSVDQSTLFQLITAANYLDIKPLLDATCKTVAAMIKGKTPEEIRKTFNIKNDFTPEEEEKIRRENDWCTEQ
jgi:S-phase kinase-associated protein 1